MADLFTRRAAVTHIPGEDEVDPELLERPESQPDSGQDFRTTSGGADSTRTPRFSSVSSPEFVDPEAPEWPAFLARLRGLPPGAQVLTQDGYTLTKQEDGSFAEGDIAFFPEELSAAHGLPPMAIL